MKKIINAGLYSVDLEGEDSIEFDGIHPTLVFRTKVEQELYIAVPFTSYTVERWTKLKNRMCCRVKSTNSIARIDKIEVITQNKIKNRWKEQDGLLIPSKPDVETVIKKALSYFEASFNQGLRDYNKTMMCFEEFASEITAVIKNEIIKSNSFISLNCEQPNQIVISFHHSKVKDLSIQELFHVFDDCFGRRRYDIKFCGEIIEVKVPLSVKKALTLKEKHVTFNASEG